VPSSAAIRLPTAISVRKIRLSAGLARSTHVTYITEVFGAEAAFSGAEKLFSAVGSGNVLWLGAVPGKPLAGQGETLRGADVVPLAVMHFCGEAACRFGPVEEPDQREDRAG